MEKLSNLKLNCPMKKCFPMLLLCALALTAAMTTSCESDTEETLQQYAIAVTAGPNGSAEAKVDGMTATQAPEGVTVTLLATPDQGYDFVRWTVERGDAVLADATSGLTTFTMPAQAVSLRAEFVEGEINVFDKMTDDLLVQFCRDYLKLDTNGDGILSLEEAQAVTELNLNELYKLFGQPILSLDGIEYFTNLTLLTCYGNQISELDVSHNTELTYLHVATNKLVQLDVTKNTKLKELYISRNMISDIDLSKCPDLQKFQSEQCTELTALDFSGNPELTAISIYGCPRLTALDFSKNPKLTVAQCYANGLTSLDVANCTALEALNCFDNQLSTLDVANCTALTILDCRGNRIGKLDVSKATSLWYLMCYKNRLTELDATAMAKPNDYSLCCGAQTSDGTTPQVLTLTLRPDQKARWQKAMAQYDDNDDVELTGGSADLFEHMDDPIFKAYCARYDTDNNGILSMEEGAAITELVVPDMELTSLAGAEYFLGLKRLICNNNKLTKLNAYYPELVELVCNDNQLTELIVWKGSGEGQQLQTIDCRNNKLTKLTVAGCSSLETLNCQNNELTELSVTSAMSLSRLNCSNNKLKQITLGNQNKLLMLTCSNNELVKLDLKGRAMLQSVMCNNNPMTSLNLSGCTSLGGVMAYACRLTELDASEMANPDGFNIFCGMQTSDGETAQTLTLTLREEQLAHWNSTMKDSFLNEGVVLAE